MALNAEKSFIYSVHPAAAAIYFIFTVIAAMIASSPVITALSLCCSAVLFFMLAKRKTFATSIFFAFLSVLAITAVNPLVSHSGVTVLFMIGKTCFTLESLLYGLDFAILMTSVVFWCACAGSVITGDRTVYLLGGVLPRTALLISMTVKYIPELARHARAIYRARRASGCDTEGGIKNAVISGTRSFSTLVGTSLEGAAETELSMRARGYGAGALGRYERYKFTFRDGAFIFAAGCFFAAALTGKALGGRFEFYPSLSAVPYEMCDILLYVSFFALAIMPIVLEIIWRIKWKFYESKI